MLSGMHRAFVEKMTFRQNPSPSSEPRSAPTVTPTRMSAPPLTGSVEQTGPSFAFYRTVANAFTRRIQNSPYSTLTVAAALGFGTHILGANTTIGTAIKDGLHSVQHRSSDEILAKLGLQRRGEAPTSGSLLAMFIAGAVASTVTSLLLAPKRDEALRHELSGEPKT